MLNLAGVLDHVERAVLDPMTPRTMVPQLLGVAARVAATMARLKLPAEPADKIGDFYPPDPPTGHPDLGPVGPDIIPGAPWDEWGETSPEDLARLNRILTARAVVWHEQRADELRPWVEPEDIAAAERELFEARRATREAGGATAPPAPLA